MSAREIITPHLVEGETVLWLGQPRWSTFQRNRVTRPVLILLGLVLTFAFIPQTDSSSWWIPVLFFLIYFSLFVILIPDLGRRTKEGTGYAVTDKRLISVFNGRNTSGIFRLLPAGVRTVELPISNIKVILIEETYRLNSNLVAVIFADYSNFLLPPYSFIDSDGGEHEVGTAYNWMTHAQTPYGYAQHSMFGFFDITKDDAEEIAHIVTTAHKMGTEEDEVLMRREKISFWRGRYIHSAGREDI